MQKDHVRENNDFGAVNGLGHIIYSILCTGNMVRKGPIMIPANECERKGDAWMAKALDTSKNAHERQKAARAAMFAYEDARKLFPSGSADTERVRKKGYRAHDMANAPIGEWSLKEE